MLDMINRLVERQEDYEAMQREIENQMNNSGAAQGQSHGQAQQSKPYASTHEDDAFSVYNRLYSYAKSKQTPNGGVLTDQDDSLAKKSHHVGGLSSGKHQLEIIDQSNSQDTQQSFIQQREQQLRQQEDKVTPSKKRLRAPKINSLYEDFHERERRLKAV